MKNLFYIIIYLIFLGCSTKEEKSKESLNEKKNMSSVEENLQQNSVESNQVLSDYDINENLSQNDIQQTKLFLDSLNEESADEHSSYKEGNVFYSPDNYLKIYSLKGEGCGAYCNPFWISIAEWNFDNQKIRKEFGVRDIIGVYNLPYKNPHTYLILTNGELRNGSIIVNEYNAIIFTIKQDSIVNLRFSKDNETLAVSDYGGCDITSIFQFEPKNQILKYKFCDFDPYSNNDLDSIVEAEYKYIDGYFNQIKNKVYKKD